MAKKTAKAATAPKTIDHSEMLRLIRSYKSNQSAISDLKAQLEEDKEAITATMKAFGLDEYSVESPEGDHYKATFREVASERFDSIAFKKEHPDIYARYIKASSSPRFNVS